MPVKQEPRVSICSHLVFCAWLLGEFDLYHCSIVQWKIQVLLLWLIENITVVFSEYHQQSLFASTRRFQKKSSWFCHHLEYYSIETKTGINEYVINPYNLANFCENQSKGDCSSYCWYVTCCYPLVTLCAFPFPCHLQQKWVHWFSRCIPQAPQTTWIHTRMCLLMSAEFAQGIKAPKTMEKWALLGSFRPAIIKVEIAVFSVQNLGDSYEHQCTNTGGPNTA